MTHSAANATLLSTNIPIANISLSLDSTGSNQFVANREGTLIGDNSIFKDNFPTNAADTYSYLANSNQFGSLESPHAYFIIPVLGFVNITIDAWGAATTGVAANLNGTRINSTETNVSVVRQQSDIAPFARMDAFLTAALSVGIADVGVKGSLNLLNLSLPLSYDSDWDLNTYSLNGSLDLVLGTLSGQVAAFIDLPWPAGDIEGTIFSWNGVETRQNLFSKNINLMALATRDALVDGQAESDEDLESDQ